MAERGPPEKDRLKRLAAMELATSAAPILVAAIVVGYLGGDWLDRSLGTKQICMPIGVLLGAAAGFFEIYRIVRKMQGL